MNVPLRGLTPVSVPDAAHRLSKLLLRQGRRPPDGTKAWTGKYWSWLSTARFEYAAQEATLLDYRTEVDRAADRIERIEKALRGRRAA